MKEALENLICPSGGCPPINGDCYFDRKRLRFENILLKEEVCKSLSKYPLMQKFVFIHSNLGATLKWHNPK